MTVTIAVSLFGKLGQDFTLNVKFKVPSQGVTALLGPSGSGKTSVLRALAGLDRHRGEVRFGAEVWQDAVMFAPAHQRRVGYGAQGTSLLPHLTIAKNLAYASRRAPAGRLKRDDVIARTGIEPLLERTPAALSGGEAQRASIARALLGQPCLLLMDEPLSGLDGEARSELLGQLEKLLAELKIPVFYVTHDAGEAKRLAEQSVELRNGIVIFKILSNDPSDQFAIAT